MEPNPLPPQPPLGDAQPLSGLRVVELATVLAGPLVGTFLAELGADVMKVEPVGRGDVTRQWRSPGESRQGPGAYYAAANGPKKVVHLDLKSAAGQQRLEQELATADILLQNARTTSLPGLGLDPQELAIRHPRLIHVHLKGFLDDPDRGGYDMVVQAETGFMDMNGETDGDPMRMPVALMDVLAAHQMRSALLLALYEREKSGEGAYIETWLDASGFSALANRATEHLVAGQVPARLGAQHPQIAPYGETVTCACGGRVVLAVGNDAQFAGLADLLGHPEWTQDDRFATNPARVVHRKELHQFIADGASSLSAADFLSRARTRGIPMGMVKSVPEALDSPVGQAMTAEFEMEGAALRHVRQVAFRIHRSGNWTT